MDYVDFLLKVAAAAASASGISTATAEIPAR
jgi:hypothetical protein